jgi:ABC-type Mn2+/Zn2+ transport system permease subunit
MRILFRIYVDQLLKGNPFVVAVTLALAIGLSVGPFYEGLKSGDPAAIGLVVLILLGITLVLVVAIIDRRNDPERKRKKKRPPSRSSVR